MSNVAPATRIRPREKPNSLLWRIAVVALWVGGVLLFCSLIIYWFGRVSGQEFNPLTFQRRSYVYYEIPLLRLQVVPIRRSSRTGKLEKLLLRKTYVKSIRKREATWDLIYEMRADGLSDKGDAALLCEYFDARSSDFDRPGLVWTYHRYWFVWTNNNPKLAAVIWPAVEEAARLQLYVLTPDLFNIARAATDAKALQAAVDEQLARSYKKLGEAQQELGRHEGAIELLTAAISRQGDNAELYRARAVSYETLKQSEKAKLDRDKAFELAPEGPRPK